MSNKKEKALRRVCRKEYTEKILQAQNEAVINWLTNLFKKPLKTRIKVALKIIRGK